MKDSLEKMISNAEISWKSGKTEKAIRFAEKALASCNENEKIVALKIFLARAYSKQGDIPQSNKIYRELIKDEIYMPPVILGLLYNNFKTSEKVNMNIKLIKIFI